MSSVLRAELFAIWRGLLLAWECGFKDVIRETDCLDAFLATRMMDPSKCDANRDLLSKIFEVIYWKWNAEIILIQRTANRVADMLARQAVTDQMTYTEWFLPPNPVLSVIQDDMHPGVSRC
ncbi:hypothetical protein PIB30_032570 [Stylosanthes scabra]|uniref:RNase H type-1 domain-containing protein n=1 Tax=Stylosanthes scabra TaxID=79078 RepID=A0ABU6RCE1_9FABA|nr:hypothetical protein [Stylosanthes scabra]